MDRNRCKVNSKVFRFRGPLDSEITAFRATARVGATVGVVVNGLYGCPIGDLFLLATYGVYYNSNI